MEGSAGRLIVFEGVDAAGKTTLCDDLCRTLEGKQLPVRRFHFPGMTPGTLGELVYRVHHYHADHFGIPTVDPCALQLLHIAAHVDIIESTIKRSVVRGDWVVLDRFWWSTYVYGVASGVSEVALKFMINVEKSVWGAVVPDVLLLIDTASPLRDDEANCDAWHRKRELYLQMVEAEGDIYPCSVIQTAEGEEGKNRAAEVILRKVLNWT